MFRSLTKPVKPVERYRTLVQRIRQQRMDTQFTSQRQAALYGVLQQRLAQTSTLFLQRHSKTCQPCYGDGVTRQPALIRYRQVGQ